ncbi:putative ankyrin repeat protein RF_0381 [Haliotis rufescens]|uniref:putative ankyrin repeat protein RF_0381 n=1 Tax=Haliotis rufescens TaxID=6454 RepID=UPI00201E8376|nr:putative ankyrin repeat protein RF_0381 [Haliotis rufescens]
MAPVMLAAQNAHRQVFDFLVGQGANTSILSRADMNILHMACEGGNDPIVKHVLQQTVTDINSRRRDGSTAVMQAVLNGHINVLNLLVSKGVDLTMFDDKGSTLLEKAIQGGNTEIVKYVFNQTRVDINRKHCGLTPVMHAAYCGKLDVFMFFVQKGADLSITDENHGTILLKACDGGNIDIVKYVLEQNIVEINSKGKEDLTPAMKAARRGHRDIFELLVKKGANLALKDEWDFNILHHACDGGNADIVKYVFKQNSIDINTKKEDGRTPAMMAAYKGHKEVFDLLIRNGADITVDVDIFDSNILHLACQGGNVNIVKYVLKQNSIDINTKEEDGRTPAMMAAKSGHGEVLDLLMRKGANLRLEDTYDNNFLYFTVKGQLTELVEYVITKNIVDINSKNYKGNAPVMLATEKGFGKVFDLLVSKDANLGIVNAEQENILHLVLDQTWR